MEPIVAFGLLLASLANLMELTRTIASVAIDGYAYAGWGADIVRLAGLSLGFGAASIGVRMGARATRVLAAGLLVIGSVSAWELFALARDAVGGIDLGLANLWTGLGLYRAGCAALFVTGVRALFRDRVPRHLAGTCVGLAALGLATVWISWWSEPFITAWFRTSVALELTGLGMASVGWLRRPRSVPLPSPPTPNPGA